MSELTDRLRAVAEEWWECCDDIHVPITEAAAAIDALQAKLDVIDALHQPQYRELDAGVIRLLPLLWG